MSGFLSLGAFEIHGVQSKAAMNIMAFTRILSGIVLLLVATGGAAAADPKRILLIYLFAQDFSPWREYEYHIRAELRRQLPEPLEIFEASLATARLADNTLDDVFAQYLGSLSARYKLDLVVTIGAPAANFFLKVRQQIFPTVPMILRVLKSVGYHSLTLRRTTRLSRAQSTM